MQKSAIFGIIILLIVIVIGATLLTSRPDGNSTAINSNGILTAKNTTTNSSTTHNTNTSKTATNQTTTQPTNTVTVTGTNAAPLPGNGKFVTEAQAETVLPSNGSYSAVAYTTPANISNYLAPGIEFYGNAIKASDPTMITVSNYTMGATGHTFIFQTLIITTPTPLPLYYAAMQQSENYYPQNATLNGMTYSISSFTQSKGEILDLYGYKQGNVVITSYQGQYDVNSTRVAGVVANALNG